MRILAPSLAFILTLQLMPSSAQAQESLPNLPFTIPFNIPRNVSESKLVKTDTSGGAAMYRYQAPAVTALTVYIYPFSLESSAPDSLVDQRLRGEVESFKQALPIGIQRGWFDRYVIAFDDPYPVQLGALTVPGYVVAVPFNRSGRTYADFFYIFALEGMLIKIRLTLPHQGWEQNAALEFPKQFIQYVAASG